MSVESKIMKFIFGRSGRRYLAFTGWDVIFWCVIAGASGVLVANLIFGTAIWQ